MTARRRRLRARCQLRERLAAVRRRIGTAAIAAAGRADSPAAADRGDQIPPGRRRSPRWHPWASPTSARTGTRRRRKRRPRLGGPAACAGTSSASCKATRPNRWHATPTPSTPWTGRSWSTALARAVAAETGPHRPAGPGVLHPGQPRGRRRRAPRRRRRRRGTRAGRAARRGAGLRPRRGHGGGTAGRDAGTGVRKTGGHRRATGRLFRRPRPFRPA